MPQSGREVVIVEAVRTPIGRGHPREGLLQGRPPERRCSARPTPRSSSAPGIDPAEVEDVVAGCVQQFGEQGFNIARNAWLQAGLPVETPATTVDRQCGSAQQAVNFAAALIASGVHDVVIGAGVEHMGHVPIGIGLKWRRRVRHAVPARAHGALRPRPQGLSAELIADRWEIPRSELDELGLRSHQLAAPGDRGGPLRARDRSRSRSTATRTSTDQGIRPDTSARDARGAEAGLQGGRQGHRRQLVADLRRRGRGAADGAREGRRARAASRARGSSTRRPSASTR